MEQDSAQFERMTGKPVSGLVLALSGPTVISMLVTSLYNMADTFFVSKLGTSASGAVGIVFSLMAIIQAVGFTLGMGSGSWISRLLGARRREEANEVAASGFYSAIVFGLVIAVAGLAFLAPLMRVLGATETILPYARDYASWILYAAPVMAASFVLNNILRAEGKARFAMIGISVGGLLNCFLDPLFIFAFKLGIGGAAIATALSQCVSFAILLSAFVGGKTVTSVAPAKASRRADTYLRIVKNGLPSLCRQGLSSVSTIALNLGAAAYGDAAVAAMAIVAKIAMFVFSVLIGVGQGYQPVLGYNYGAGRNDRVRAAFSFTFKFSIGIAVACAAAIFAAAPAIMEFFLKSDPEVVRIGTFALRAQCLAMPLVPIGMMANMTFQGIGKSWTATLLSAARQGYYFIPFILILPGFLGLKGLQVSQALADGCTFLTCLPFVLRFFRSLGRGDEKKTPGPAGPDAFIDDAI
jgi:putative MATE family efflux protein